MSKHGRRAAGSTPSRKTTQRKIVPAQAFFAKAEKHWKWATVIAVELGNHGRRLQIEDVERCLSNFILQIDVVHESLERAAHYLGEEIWLEALKVERAADLLLNYLWKARNAEAHDIQVKWESSEHLQFTVVDALKAQAISRGFYQEQRGAAGYLRLMDFITGASAYMQDYVINGMRIGNPTGALFNNLLRNPPTKRLAQAGCELVEAAAAFRLNEFVVSDHGKTVRMLAPTFHLGAPLDPSTRNLTSRALSYYENKINDLRKLITA